MNANNENTIWPEPTERGMIIPCDGMVTNLEFHDAGQYLAVTTNQGAIHLVDCLSGTQEKTVFTKKDGIGKIQFTHHEMCLLMSCALPSEEQLSPNCDLKYLSVYDNRYLRYFSGHTGFITSLSMNPINDQFLSASYDNTVRLWDVSCVHSVAKISLPLPCGPFYTPGNPNGYYRPPLCAYDSSGLIFGILHHSTLKLYDARNYQAGPFENIFPSQERLRQSMLSRNESLSPEQINRFISSSWTNFEFSSDGGNSVLINTNTEALFLLDGLNPENEPKVITSRKNDSGQSLGATFTADPKYVVTGNDDNEILYYDRNTLELQSTLTGHSAPVGVIRCNKVYDVMASGCVNAVLWIQSPNSQTQAAEFNSSRSSNE